MYVPAIPFTVLYLHSLYCITAALRVPLDCEVIAGVEKRGDHPSGTGGVCVCVCVCVCARVRVCEVRKCMKIA